MAEFCLECWNKLNKKNLTKKDVHLSKEQDFCERCATWKPVIVKYKERNIFKKLFPRLFY